MDLAKSSSFLEIPTNNNSTISVNSYSQVFRNHREDNDDDDDDDEVNVCYYMYPGNRIMVGEKQRFPNYNNGELKNKQPIQKVVSDDGSPTMLAEVVEAILFEGSSSAHSHAIKMMFPLPPTTNELREMVKHRFDVLPLHKLCYYQSLYSKRTARIQMGHLLRLMRRLNKVICHLSSNSTLNNNNNNLRSSQQDVFGMTALHILVLSNAAAATTTTTNNRLELFQAVLTEYPKDVIVQDKWGAFPIHYACVTGASYEVLKLLIQTQQHYFPNYNLGWDRIVASPLYHGALYSPPTIRTVVQLTIGRRIMYFTGRHYDFANEIPMASSSYCWNETKAQIDTIYAELRKREIQENFALVECILWNRTILLLQEGHNEVSSYHRERKRAKLDQTALRQHCRASCQHQYQDVIQRVLSFL
eukprot:scaffold618_cov130-Cylindrotheca_fusiformis.AAC.43